MGYVKCSEEDQIERFSITWGKWEEYKKKQGNALRYGESRGRRRWGRDGELVELNK